jgi:hypothetical protein
MAVDKRYIALIVVFAVLAIFIAGDQYFSVFFYGGKTVGASLDANGIYGDAKEFAFATGELSSNSFGATFWTLKAKDASGFTKTGKDMTVFMYTYPNDCAFNLKPIDDPLNTAVLSANSANLLYGTDYKVFDPETPSRNQKVDVIVLGPGDKEKQLSDMLKNVLPTLNSGLVSPAQTAWATVMRSSSYDYTFDAYRDDVQQVGPDGIYRIKFSGTHEGATDCFSLVEDDTIILYSAKEGKAYPIDRSKLSAYTTSALISSFFQAPSSSRVNLSSDDLAGKPYSVSSGMLHVTNQAPGNIQLTILAPASVFYNPITGGVSEEPQVGGEETGIDFGGFGEPAPCQVQIVDVAFSGDNTNRYVEGQNVLTYVKVKNPGASQCLVSVSASAGKATADTKQVSLAGYASTQVPLQVNFGEIPSGELQDSITYKVCASSVVAGTYCDQRTIAYTLLDEPVSGASVLTGDSSPSPDPQPDLTCEERVQTRQCGYNDFACEAGKAWGGYSCLDYFVPLAFGVGLTGLILALVVILVIAYWYFRRR